MSGEFDLIAKYFSPLAAGVQGAFGLKDDVAAIAAGDLAVTKDLLVEGVHFRSRDPKECIARKALRVNLSDLAAKGARPFGYFLGCVWPAGVKESAIAEFAGGLRLDQDLFKIALFGGDTTAHVQKGAPFTVSVTMIGLQGPAGLIPRAGAQAGDDVYVSGTIGDAGLGLAALEGEFKLSSAHKAFLADRYRLPSPRLSLGGALGGHANSAIDVSDGLIADARHIATQSGVTIEIGAEKIPLSAPAKAWLGSLGDFESGIGRLATSGDDYEILFTAPSSRRRSIEMASQVSKTAITRIGSVARGAGVKLVTANGTEIAVAKGGFDHFGD